MLATPASFTSCSSPPSWQPNPPLTLGLDGEGCLKALLPAAPSQSRTQHTHDFGMETEQERHFLRSLFA